MAMGDVSSTGDRFGTEGVGPDPSRIYLWTLGFSSALAAGGELVLSRLAPEGPLRIALSAALPAVLMLSAATYLGRRARTRLRHAVAAAESLASGQWDTPIAGTGGDAASVMLASLERVRSNTQAMLARIHEAGSRVHGSSVGLGRAARDLYQDIATFSSLLAKVSDGAQQQARLTDEMQSGMDTVAANAHDHRALADAAAAIGSEAHTATADSVRQIETTLGQWESALAELREAGTGIADLEDTTRAISGIVEIIGEIARRTHVLSLNASLEAVRAGDRGEGFAVMATEVRALAEDTARRAQTIDDILQRFFADQRRLLQRLSQGIRGLDRSRNDIGAVRSNLQRTVEAFGAIADRVTQLARGFDVLAGQIASLRAQTANVNEISRQHATLVREAVGQTRDQMLVGADQLMHEGRNLDRIAKDLTALVRIAGVS